MGKIRKSKPPRAKRSLAADNSDEEEQLPVDNKENAIQTILDQLQGADIEEKYCGLQTFAMLIENPENIPQIINRGLVKVAAPLLLDPASSVRNAAAGALRNLSTVAMETCDAMMEQDVMTPVTCYFHEHAESWVPDPNSKTKDEDSDTFIQCVNLLLNLCESSDLAVKYLGQSRILDILPRYLDLGTFSSEIVTAVLQCLFVVVEDNPAAMNKIKSNAEKQLETLLGLEGTDPSVLLVKTLAAGVIINTCGGNITTLPVDVIRRIMTILANTLSVDHRLICSQLSSNVPLSDGSGKVEAPKGKAAQQLDSQIQSVTQMLTAQQSSIEIIANICSCEDGDDQGNDSSESDEADEELCENGDEGVLAEDKLPPEMMEAFISLEVFDKVWARTQLPAQNVMLILKEYDGSQLIYKRLLSLQTRALLCINNLLSTLPIENLGGVNGVYKIWVDTGKLAFKQDPENENLAESATAVMRAALDKIKFRDSGNSNDCNLFSDLALSDIELMLTGIKECQVPEIRSNLIRMVGILALLLVNNLNDVTSNVICTITEFILEQAHKENEVWVLAEAIDTLVDVYSEDETDVLAAKVKLTDKLAILAPILKNKARQQKRLPKEYKVLVSTATSNLPRFIKYKKDRISRL
ncbi:HEAT repeat-containing protein 3 isoform X2 [Spodoptera litura]|uniref:HEAT repeat-containing protein 3 isoform X2 n=1 Tax=Spodoptera litura TaxID=69820 RepID=A0A9J7E3F6_SPOLT|nr:HEAT repeat-containing protein 3 isoform X2 [Spodoptera litura]